MSGRVRLLPAGLTLLLLVLAGIAGSRLHVDHDIARVLPDSDPALLRSARAMGGLLELTVIDVGADDESVSVESLGHFADRLVAGLIESGSVEEAHAGVRMDEALDLIELLQERSPLLFGDSEWEEIGERVRPDVVPETIVRLAQRMMEPDGDFAAQRAEVDPLGLSDLALAPLASLASGRAGADIVDGRIVSADGRHVLVRVEPGFPASDSVPTGAFLAALEELSTELTKEAEFQGVRVRHVGAHRSTRENERQIRRDVRVTSIVGITAAALLTLLCFGRVRVALFALTPALVGAVAALGVFSLFRESIAAPVLGFGAVLVGLTIDFAVHVLARVTRAPTVTGGGEPAPLPVRPLVLGALSTSLAFALLRGSSVPGIRDIGTFGAIGILAAAAYALLVLPAATPLLGAARRPLLDLERVLRRVGTPRRTALFALLVTPLIGLGALRLSFDGDVQNLSSLGAEAADDEQAIGDTWGGGQASWVVVEHTELESALIANDALERWLAKEREGGGLLEYSSITALLPSRATQAARLARWNAFWSDGRRAELEAGLAQGAERTLFRAAAFDPFLRALDEDPKWITREDLIDRSGGQVLRDRLIEGEQSWLVLTPIRTTDWNQLARLEERLHAEQPGAVLANREGLMRAVADVVSSEMAMLGAAAFLAVALVVSLWLGESILTFVVLLPLVLALVWTLGIFGWVNQELNLINAIFVVFQFGIAIDYSIFMTSSYLDRLRTERDHTIETRAAALLCALTTCTGFGAMALARHPVMNSIGIAALIGIASAALATHLFVPVLCEGVLAARGPGGTPGPRNVLATLWIALRLALRRRGLDGFARDAWRRLPLGRRDCDGEEQLRELSARVLVANHESDCDALCVLALVPHVHAAQPESLRQLPIAGALFREGGDKGVSAARAKELLDKGRSLLFFPAGDGPATSTRPFGTEAFALARALDVPVQPVALVNTRGLRQPGGWIGDHDLRVSALEALHPRDFDGKGGDARLAAEAERRIRRRCSELWLETLEGPQWHHLIAGLYRHHGPLVKNYAASKAKRDPLVRAIPRLCPGDGPILVVGCGYGLLTSRLALAYPTREIVALDPDVRKLDIARRALGDTPHVRFLEQDVRAHDATSYEWILLVDVLHYWDEPRQREILDHVSGLLAPDAKLVFRDGCRTEGVRHWFVHGAEAVARATGFTRVPGDFQFHSEEGWRKLLADCGYRIQSSDPSLGLFSNFVLVCSKEARS
jgi:predicted exporter/1-acyl-sn-glycerol-3-phosphate acyltransferase/SAM-dependent methyltransferase